MVTRKKVDSVRQVPKCVADMYEQFRKGRLLLSSQFGPYISVVPSMKSIFLYLCCRDKACDSAYALWNELRRLKGEGFEYEAEAATLVSDTAWYVVDYKGLTRSELRTLDEALAEAADRLYVALVNHDDDFNDFKNESSAACWPEEHMSDIGRMLRGVPCSNERLAGGYHFAPFDEIDWPLPSREDRLFWVLRHCMPPMPLMLKVLARRARELSSSRFDARKRRESAGDAPDTRFIRRLIAGVIRRNPAASADQIAKIVSPIADRVVGGKTLARCKKAAQRIKRELEADGTINPS